MTNLKRLLLASSLILFLFSFSSVLAQNSPNLEMSNAKLESQQSITFNPRFTSALSGRDADDYPFSRQYIPSRENDRVIYSNSFIFAKAVARNTSAKTIKAVTWEYSFFSDAKMTQLLKNYQFYSKRKIHAGERKALKGEVITPITLPAKTLTTLISTQHKTVRPLLIEYTDGTVWKAH